MAITNALLIADVVHARHRQRKNAFRYRVFYLCFGLSQLSQMARMRLLSLDRFNLFGVHARDHAAETQGMEGWIRGLLTDWKIAHADGEIVLLTLPRVLGYVFNPVSFWFCLTKSGDLACVLSEVRNTFGERHCYLSYHEDGRPIDRDEWLESRKLFHVSPFIALDGYYRLRFAYGEESIGVWINHLDANGMVLSTSLTGKRHALSDGALLRCFFRYPLVTLKVIVLIHYQALKLISKGIPYTRKPAPPATEVSR
jgi:DUF1365 family protein